MNAKYAILILFVLGFLVLAGIAVRNYLEMGSETASDHHHGSTGIEPVLPAPKPRDVDYVGSQACAECHRDLYDRYTQSAMGQSMAKIDVVTHKENYEDATIEPGADQRYRVVQDDAGVRHEEVTTDENGEVIVSRSVPIHYVIGSGERGRTYVTQRDGALYQSPIGWYAADNRWDLSPGYTPGNHHGFSRRIDNGCLYCHAGHMNTLEGATSLYEEDACAEAIISCERCHGPGKQHVAFRNREPVSADEEDPIVNPSDLPVRQRDSVCYQCHLLGHSVVTRNGRGFYDFRPGDVIADNFIVMSQKEEAGKTRAFAAVSQVEQMQSSGCYKAADGKLGCISCHDPHGSPSPQTRVEFYRQRCLQCHADQGCSEDVDVRQAATAEDSCVHCHMPTSPAGNVPHTAFTNHRIPRTIDTQVGPTLPQSVPDEVRIAVFGNENNTVPPVDVARAKGILQMTVAWQSQSQELAERALINLTKIIPPGDAPLRDVLAEVHDRQALEELGSGYYLLEDFDAAADCWERTLELHANNETALLGLAELAKLKKDVASFDHYVEKLEGLVPWDASVVKLRLTKSQRDKNFDEGIAIGEQALTIHPLDISIRSIVIELHRVAGNQDAVLRHESIAKKLKGRMR